MRTTSRATASLPCRSSSWRWPNWPAALARRRSTRRDAAVRSVWTLCLTIGALAVGGDPGGAQAPSPGGAGRAGATRSELEQLAARVDRAASADTAKSPLREQRRVDAAAIRTRLREGDFRPGDQIVLTVPADS